MAQQQLDVLSVGNVVTDVFIRLLEDEAQVEKTPDGQRLSMAYGTKVPFDHSEVVAAVGNASNAAVSFAKLGLRAGLMTNVGGDEGGREILRTLREAEVDNRFVHVNHERKSQTHFVLWYKEERTILV